LIEQIGHFLAAITWDRIGDNGAAFEVVEIHDARLHRARLQPGKPRIDLPSLPINGGVVLAEPEFTVCAALCDHGTPAVAYSLTTRQELNVRKERLAARGLPPGPWLANLKQALWRDEPGTRVPLPDGTEQSAGSLAEDLVLVRPGRKLAYAADTADTPENRDRLIALARGAHTFFCEAAFTLADRARAHATQHLTGHAAAEIAVAAGAERLAPFHFSRRYERDPDTLWSEIRNAAGAVTLLGAPSGPSG
jgi:ribonuclease BN (tRNA processing enzyme)